MLKKLINIHKIKINETKKIFTQGVWENNSILIQLLGLCPLLAVSSNATNSLGLGIVTTLVLIFSNVTVSAFRYRIPHEIRIPIYVMIISSIVSSAQMLINAYSVILQQSLGIFLPLIVTNCVVIGRVESYAIKNTVYRSAIDAVSMGIGLTIILFFLGAMREILGNGTLFSGINFLLGDWAKILYIKIIHFNSPFLLAILPPGAFIGLGLMLAGKNLVDEKIKNITKKKNYPL